MYAAAEQIQKVKDHLRARIFRGELSEGAQIVEADLRVQTHASVRAIKRALQDLAREGLVSRRRHVGTFVSGQLPSAVCAVLPRIHSAGVISSYTQRMLGETGYTHNLLSGIRSMLKEPGILSLITNPSRAPIDDVPAVEPNTIRNSLQGLIAVEANNARILNDLTRAGIPLVAVDYYAPGHLFDALLIDHEMAGYLATAHHLRLGHRRIAFVGEGCSRASHDPAWQDRLSGYLHAMAEAGGAEPQPLLLDAGRSSEQFLRVFPPFFKRFRPTAIVAAGFAFARGVVEVLEAEGLHWAKDYSLSCAEGGFQLSKFQELTAVHIDHEQVGREAVRVLASRLACSAMPAIRRVLPVELAVRETAAPLRKAE